MTTPNFDAEQTYLTTSQAAKYMGVTVEAVCQLCTQQILKGTYQENEDGPYRIPIQAVETWLQQQNQSFSTIFDQRGQQVNQQTNIAGDFIQHIKYIFFKKPNQKHLNSLRQKMYFQVQDALYDSFYSKIRIQLELSKQDNAIDYPWDLIWHQNGSPDIFINEQTQLIDIYKQVDERILILGEPGAGKTTTLLILAETLLQRTKNDPTLSTPVIFNLSSWVKGQPFIEWLIKELYQHYQIQKRVSQNWMEESELILLLDGLDEVAKKRRDACVAAINEFQSEYGVGIVVCSRTTEYESLTNKLQLHGAVVVCPLTQLQIDTYITDLGIHGVTLQQILGSNNELRELANTPLMLNVMTLAYQDNELQNKNENRNQIEILFDQYIQRMFQHRRKNLPHQYTSQQTLYWLQWLADQMVQHNQTLFIIKRLQLSWLSNTQQINWYRLFVGTIIALIIGLSIGQITNLHVGMGIGLFIGSISGLFDNVNAYEKSDFSIKIGLIGMLVFGLLVTLVTGLTVGGIIYFFFPYITGITTISPIGLLEISRFGLSAGLLFGYFLGSIFGAFITLFVWLIISLKHFILRTLLYLYNRTPYNYTRFLNYTTTRLFLRKSGGGYVFIHRIIMEHIAALTDEDIERIVKSVERR